MKVSTRGDYACRALLSLALHGDGRNPTSVREIADRTGLPQPYLEQILLALKGAGLVRSKRGVGGGYTLVRPADQIRLGDVISVFDGPLAPVPCSVEKPVERCTCPDPATCPVRLTMTQVRQEIASVLGDRTIEDMVRLAPGPAPMAFEI